MKAFEVDYLSLHEELLVVEGHSALMIDFHSRHERRKGLSS